MRPILLAILLLVGLWQTTASGQSKHLFVAVRGALGVLQPVATIADGLVYQCWPSPDSHRENRFKLPRPLSQTPVEWVGPARTVPLLWRYFDTQGTRFLEAKEIVEFKPLADPMPGVRVTGDRDDRREYGVALGGATSGVGVRPSRTVDSGSVEGRSIIAAARALLLDEITSEIRNWKPAADESTKLVAPSTQALRDAEAREVTIVRVDGVAGRPLVIDFDYHFGPTAERCDSRIHVNALLREIRPGQLTLLSQQILVDPDCAGLSVDTYPIAVLTIRGADFWVGRNQYEDGEDFSVFRLVNGALELAPFGDCVRQPRVPPSLQARPNLLLAGTVKR